MNRAALLLLALMTTPGHGLELVSGGGLKREFAFDGKVWRTVSFGEGLPVTSDEFHIRTLDDREWSVSDYRSTGKPEQNGNALVFHYVWPEGSPLPKDAPAKVTIRFEASPGQACIRKEVELEYSAEATIDRLEVERFTTEKAASRGGRGEPVFIAGKWFFGLEYPAGHSRHTDGNTPEPNAHHYEMVGNYSFIDLEKRDQEAKPQPGLVRLFHFPGFAKKEDGRLIIRSKTAVTGIAPDGLTVEEGFSRYLENIAKPARSFTHYNNWFDPAGKSLKGDNFPKIHAAFQEALKGYDIRIDAMVPDDGWQNRASVWDPAAAHFPKGFEDLKALSEALQKDGTSLGLWLALNGTNTNVGWGETQGYKRAKANKYFSQYFTYYSLSADGYRGKLEQQLRKLAGEAKISYFKHDFNHLSDTGDGRNHPPTDRHGHEANVDAMISLLTATREANAAVYQNLTNWVWFSPWWLMHGDALWMLAGDDGFNGNWPELSTRAMATTDRDAYIWRMWGDASDRPLVPISRLMTHGIIRNPRNQMEGPRDTLRDWADHVMMYYGRGIQMKEWYLTPAAMSPEQWKSLATIHRWSEKNFKALANNVWVGDRPDEGHVYGYTGWDGDHGVLVARNPGPSPQVLRVPFGRESGFTGDPGREFGARVVYPYHAPWSRTFTSGETMEIEIPGYETLAFEFGPGSKKADALGFAKVASSTTEAPGKVTATVEIPADLGGRGEILVIGYPDLPEVKIDGQTSEPVRSSKSALNHFAGYARAGMPSDKVRPWQMASYDIREKKGKRVSLELRGGESESRAEAWLLAERKAEDADFDGRDLPWAVSAGTRRQTISIIPERTIPGTPVLRRALTPAELAGLRKVWLEVELFGLSEGHGMKTLFLNGQKAADLPAGGDEWKRVRFELPEELAGKLGTTNTAELRHDSSDDKFKFKGLELRVELADGTIVRSTLQETPQTSFKDWAHFEGLPFPTGNAAEPVVLRFAEK